MRGEAMFRICNKLLKKGQNLNSFTGLEFFAREGDWQTKSFAKFIKILHAWEINPVFKDKLSLNHPNAIIRIGDSFEFAKEIQYKAKFDFIVFDNPQSIYNNYCEHFEALENVSFLLKDSGIVIFNINKKPFNYSKESLWAKRRNNYYKTEASNLESEFLLRFYSKLFNNMGFDINEIFEEKRNNDYLSYIILILNKIAI